MGLSAGWMVQHIISLQAAAFDAAGLAKRGNWEGSGCFGHDEV